MRAVGRDAVGTPGKKRNYCQQAVQGLLLTDKPVSQIWIPPPCGRLGTCTGLWHPQASTLLRCVCEGVDLVLCGRPLQSASSCLLALPDLCLRSRLSACDMHHFTPRKDCFQLVFSEILLALYYKVINLFLTTFPRTRILETVLERRHVPAAEAGGEAQH